MEAKMELLAPAGSPEILKAVIDAGADAVYLGGDRFGARAYANNFTTEQLLEALDYAHLRGKKIYLTVNTLLKNQEIAELKDYLQPLYAHGLDAVLVQDFGALVKIHEWFPDMEIHTSTQMTVTGVEGVRLLKHYGVTRVVMAREVSLEEMNRIHEETGMELEAFIHGALCYSYSGQCLFSSLIGGRSGNRGRCAQPCRLPYTVLDANKNVIKQESFLLSLKDFCCVNAIDKLRQAGVYSLKIEGRMKQLSYAAGVVSYYRKYVDLALSDEPYQVTKEDEQALEEFGNRCGFTDGYLYQHNGSDMVTFEKPSFCQTRDYVENHKAFRSIYGALRIKANEPIQLMVWDETNHCVTVFAEEPSAAQRMPITKAEVEKRIRKTKDTAFLFDALTMELDDNLFVPNSILNQLKRDALAQLQEQIVSEYRRTSHQPSLDIGAGEHAARKSQDCLSHVVSLENRALLNTVLQSTLITDIYLDSTAYDRAHMTKDLLCDATNCKNAGKRVFLILPSIFRSHTMEFYQSIVPDLSKCNFDGFVIKNLEGFWFVKHYFSESKIVCDHNLYTYNDIAADGFRNAGAYTVTIPLELNRKELARRRNDFSEMWIYGYYPLMTSAQCVCRNTSGCTHTSGLRYLRDRMKKDFPVRNCCSECVNVIYNSLPTMLFSYLDELQSYQIHRFRLHFSIESKEEVQKLLALYEQFVFGHTDSIPDSYKELYTNGHYKRGVE